MDAVPSPKRTATDLTDLPKALSVVTELVVLIGPEKVAGCTVHSGAIRIEPSELGHGEGIAALLGLHSVLDHHTTSPGFTDWSGLVSGVEVHVRGALHRRVA
ncbi:hypothetical protein [Promicromonospora soli]